MSTRKIKDAKDLTTNELIYFKGHAKATYMSDGTTVEDAINNIETGNSNIDLSEYATKEELNDKQDTINDLDSIRSGAAKGATSVQQGTLSAVATSGSYNDLTNKPTIPNAVSESTVSSWGFTKNTGTYIKPSTGIPKTDLASAIQTSLGKADTALQTETYKGTITGISANGTSIATSGVANIPAASTSAYGVTMLSSDTNSTSTTLAATASAVKEAYDLANSKQATLVSGTNIKTINGTSILGSGDITISGSEENSTQPDWNETDTTSPAYIANKPNITVENGDLKIRSIYSIDFESNGYSINIPNPKFRNYIDIGDASGIISGSNITFYDSNEDSIGRLSFNGNGTKFLSDDGTYKEISSNSSDSSSGAYAEVNHGTSDTTFTLTPNTFHIWDEVTTLDLSLGEELNGVANEYLFQFNSGATATTLILPDSIKWANNSAPIIAENRIYQVSVLKGLASCLEFNNMGELIENKLTIISNGTGQSTFTFEYPVASDVTLNYINEFNISGTSIIENGTQSAETIFEPGNENIVSVVIIPNSDNTYIYTL